MEEKTYTTEELLFELGISEHLFRKRLFHRGIITSMDGDFTLPIDYIDWAVFEYFEGMTKQHLLWTQKGHDNLLEIFGEQTEKPAFFSCIDIALELGISHMQLRKILVEKGIVQSMKGETTLTHNYQDWGKMVPVNGTNQVRFRWTEKGYDSILEMLGDLKTNSNGLKQSDNSLSQNMPNALSVYTSDDISKALHISKIELRQFLVNKGIVRSMKGKIGVYLDYSDWGTLRFNSKAREKLFVWTEKGRENILKLYHSSQNESTDYMQNVEVRGRKQPILTNFSQLQKTFKTKYADSLLEQAKIGISLPNYALDIFPIDQEDILYIPSIVHPDGLLEKMNPAIEKDFESAVALYEAYPNLSPLQASDKTFWIYLAHTELFLYVRERYPDVCIENFDNSQYVQDYWFFGKGVFNHALAGLWWTVYFSVNEQDKESKYECTRFIFSRDSNFRTKYFASNQLFRHKEASIGILQFLMEDTELCSTFFRQKIRYIAKYFNKLGGTRQLISLNRDFFYHELKKIRPLIMAIQSDEDVKNSI